MNNINDEPIAWGLFDITENKPKIIFYTFDNEDALSGLDEYQKKSPDRKFEVKAIRVGALSLLCS